MIFTMSLFKSTLLFNHSYAKTQAYALQFRAALSHVPVMAKEVMDVMRPSDGKTYIDMTFGAGGHTKKLLSSNKSIRIIAVDRDPVAFKKAQELATEVSIKSSQTGIQQSVIPVRGKFSEVINQIHLSGVPYESVDGVIFDLGASSMQFDDSSRGFSLSSNAPLDMRMDSTNESDLTAEDVVNNLNENRLSEIFRLYGEEKKSRKIAAAIVDARILLGRIKTTQELAKIVSTSSRNHIDALGRTAHPATKVFQALRIFVNNELNEIDYALDKIHMFLKPLSNGISSDNVDLDEQVGRIVVISFHSLEDRIVKRKFSGLDPDEPIVKALSQHARIRTSLDLTLDGVQMKNNKWKSVWGHIQKPSDEEVAINPRSRSAKMRAAIRL